MARVVISEAEIMEELARARCVTEPDPPGAFTVAEMAKKTGKAQRTIRTEVEALNAKGMIERCYVHRRGSDGRFMRTRAYRIIRPETAKKGRR